MILILGAKGYVGQQFTHFLREKGTEVTGLSQAEISYTDAAVLESYLKQNRPSFLINAAGFTGKPNVDACESAKAETLFGNTVFPLRLAKVCRELDIPWAHISSGCIYQGDKGTDSAGNPIGFREEDAPNFDFKSGKCSFYSGTKAMAEEYLAKDAPNAYIWRLRVPFNHQDGPRNYLSKLLRYKRLLNVRNSLSHLNDFVAACCTTFERKLPFGTYNLTNPGSVTALEVVDLIRQEGEIRLAKKDAFSAERLLKKFEYFESEEEFMKLSAIAPRSSCVLDTTKLEHFHLPMRPVREALIESLRSWTWEAPV